MRDESNIWYSSKRLRHERLENDEKHHNRTKLAQMSTFHDHSVTSYLADIIVNKGSTSRKSSKTDMTRVWISSDYTWNNIFNHEATTRRQEIIEESYKANKVKKARVDRFTGTIQYSCEIIQDQRNRSSTIIRKKFPIVMNTKAIFTSFSQKRCMHEHNPSHKPRDSFPPTSCNSPKNVPWSSLCPHPFYLPSNCFSLR